MLPPRTWIALLLCLVGAQGSGADLGSDAQATNPRLFGHFIGDSIPRRVQVTVPATHRLVPEDLPKLGRINTWVSLNGIDGQSRPAGAETRYDLRFDYQVVNAPPESQLVMVPGMDLHFEGRTQAAAGTAAEALDRNVQAMPLLIAPLTFGDIRTGLEEMRPARAPPLIDSARPARFTLIFGAGTLLIGSYLAFARWGFAILGSKAGPFARAHRGVRRLQRRAPSPERDREALRLVHRAFDETAGYRVFGERLPDFFEEHAGLSGAAGASRAFFAASRQEFFGHGSVASAVQLDALLKLCAQLRAAEAPLQRGRHATAV